CRASTPASSGPNTSTSCPVYVSTASTMAGCYAPPWASRGTSEPASGWRPLLAGCSHGRDAANIQAIASALTHQRSAHRHPVADVLVQRREHELQTVLAVAERCLHIRRLALDHPCWTRALRELPLTTFASREASDDVSEAVRRQLARPALLDDLNTRTGRGGQLAGSGWKAVRVEDVRNDIDV